MSPLGLQLVLYLVAHVAARHSARHVALAALILAGQGPPGWQRGTYSAGWRRALWACRAASAGLEAEALEEVMAELGELEFVRLAMRLARSFRRG